MIKLILTLGDEEINAAINNNDITSAISLMENKGFLNDISKSNTNIKFSNEEVKKIYTEMGINVDDNYISQNNQAFAAVWALYVVAGVVSQVGVSYNVIAAMNAAVTITVYLWVEAWGQAKNINKVTNTNLPLKVWDLKGVSADSSFVAANLYISDQSKKIIKIVRENNPDLLNYISETELEQVIKINIVNSSKKE